MKLLTAENMIIRAEAAADWPQVEEVNRLAFGGEDEAKLVARLRADGLTAVALVAAAKQRIVGHIVLSWLPTRVDERPVRALALAPVAVRPEHQRNGIGSSLVRTALERAGVIGAEAVVVLGHADYYPRFGFSAALAAKLDSPFSGESFMALELTPGALAGTRGSVTYPAAFGL